MNLVHPSKRVLFCKRAWGPVGGPRDNNSRGNPRRNHNLFGSVARGNITYPATWMSYVASSASSLVTKSANTASRDCPWIMCAVDAKSGTKQNPIRRTFACFRLITPHVRETLVKGYTPGPRSLCTVQVASWKYK